MLLWTSGTIGASLPGGHRVGVAVVSAVAAALGFALLGDASPSVVADVQAFTAGAILTMLADTMMPEALENGGDPVGVVSTVGFVLAFLLSKAA